jgi:hypothetical protein
VIRVSIGPRLPNEAIQNPAGSAGNAKFHENRIYLFQIVIIVFIQAIQAGNRAKKCGNRPFRWPIGFQMT